MELETQLNEQEQKLLDDYNKMDKLPNKKHIFLLLKENGALLAAMAEDGELTLGHDMTPTDAAKEFWHYVQTHMPSSEETASKQLAAVKAHCYDLMQENKALKQKLSLLCHNNM
jgi:hypothetical protein